MSIEELRRLASEIRARIIENSHKTSTPHLGSCLSCTDILVAAYFHALRIDPTKPRDPDRDRFILSKGHGAAALFQVLAIKGTAALWSPKVLRAAMGAHFVLEIFENVELAPVVRGARVPVLATSGYAADCLYDLELAGPVAWILGHEGQGVSQALLDLASRRVAVPHAGQVESLNVAACAAVCFFEQLRQTRQQPRRRA